MIVEDDGANVEIFEHTDPVDEPTENSEDHEPIQETTNTTPEQPATVPQEQQLSESSEVEAVDDVPVSHSESTTEQESTEVVENVQGEI